MNKRILTTFSVVVALSVTAYAFLNNLNTESMEADIPSCSSVDHIRTDYFSRILSQSVVEIFYDYGSRFARDFSKERINQTTSLADFISSDQFERIVSYDSVSVIIIDHNYNFTEIVSGSGPEFNDAQLQLLRSAPYSTDILIRAYYQEINMNTGKVEDSYTTPHITISPEVQAVYNGGKEALITYVRDNTLKHATRIEEGKLQPGKVRFSISREGNVEGVFLESTSGYESLDKDVLNLIVQMPRSWKPAENAIGEKVVQEFIFSFGIVGC